MKEMKLFFLGLMADFVLDRHKSMVHELLTAARMIIAKGWKSIKSLTMKQWTGKLSQSTKSSKFD